MDKTIMSEQSVIGCIILEPVKVMSEIAGQLTAGDFCHPMGKMAIDAALKLYSTNKAISIVSILHEIGNGEDEKIFLTTCASVVPSVAPYQDYIAMVKECSRRRRAIEKAIELVTALSEGEPLTDCQTIATEASEALNDTKFGESFNAAQALTDFFIRKQKPKTYIETGFAKLDKYAYIDKGDYVIVAGRPSAGKTAFTLQMMANMARKHKVVYFSLETSKEKATDRIVSSITQTSMGEIKRHEISDWGKIARETDRFCALNFEIVEAAGWTVAQITAKAVQLKADVIFIDYLSLIADSAKGIYERVSNISVGLHTMAQQRKICVVALSQLNRAGKENPDLTSLRESGQLEQDADVVLMITEDESLPIAQREGIRKLKIAKNKEGLTGTIHFNFAGECQTFYEVAP